MLCDEKLRPSIQAKNLIEHLLRDIFLVGETLHAGIVDHDVQSSKLRHRGIEQLGHLADFADVGLDGNGAAALGLDLGDNA